MPSEDLFHTEHPELNDWMQKDKDRRPGKNKTVMSGLIQRLARSEGVASEELAERISDDTIRRTKYAVSERRMPDGSVLFEADPGIIEGPRGLVHR